MEQFGRLFVEFKKSATRIETLPAYSVEEERAQFEHYLAGKPLPADRNEEWANNIRACVADGRYMGRVHIIDHVLTPYLQFEIDWYYTINGAAGEDIRFIYREDVPELTYTDTWLFDDTVVVDLSYNHEGELLYINQNDDPKRLEQARTAWREFYSRSFPLSMLLAESEYDRGQANGSHGILDQRPVGRLSDPRCHSAGRAGRDRTPGAERLSRAQGADSTGFGLASS